MIGSQAVAAWIAQFAFWVLLVIGIAYGELTKKWAAMFVVVWLAGYIGLPRLSMFSGLFTTSYVAVLDIVLVFVVFKGDVRIG
jgi:hypothetical protein